MKSVSFIVLFSLTLVALLLLLHPSHSAPLPVPSSPRPFSLSSSHLRHLLSRNDSRHDTEERIENSNEQQARDMQQQYQQDRQSQQQEQQQQQQQEEVAEVGKHRHHTAGHEAGEIDREAVVTGDDLRHPRDPKQQQHQQQQVINNGTTTPPPSQQRDDRRDDEADKADQAGDLARSAEQQRQQQEEGGEQLVDSSEVSNGTNVTAQNNGTAPIGETHPYDHNTQKVGMYNRTSNSSHRHAGGHHQGAVARPYTGTDGRLDQSSPYHSTDPQSRTWSQQRRDAPDTPANFTAPLPPNSTYPSPSNPPPYSPSQQPPQQQPPASYNSSEEGHPLSYPQPVPTVDHAQGLVDNNEAASGSDMLESSSGSDADDEYDSEATQNSTSSGAADRDQEEEEAVISEEGSTGATNATDAPLQEPGNNVQWNVLSERTHHSHSGADDEDERSSNSAEDIRDKHNGGNRLRNEPRGGRHSHSDDERDSEQQYDRHNGRHHLDGELRSSQQSAAVDMVDVERAVSGGSVSGWLAVLLVCCVAAGGVGWWLRRVREQQKYEVVEQYDAYGDVVEEEEEEEEESESEHETQRVQVRVY